jgi:hypothetical protein
MDQSVQTTTQPELTQNQSVFSVGIFEHAQRIAKMLSASSLIPKDYQGNVQNTMIAMEMANRLGASPLMIMQHMYIVHGKPSFSSTYLIAAINASGKYSKLKFRLTGEGDNRSCVAYAKDLQDNEMIEGPAVTIKMAKDEGWFSKNGSKWKTMPDVMLAYRAAAFFSRLHCPEITMGIQTNEEVIDITPTIQEPVDQEAEKAERVEQRVKLLIQNADTVEKLQSIQGDIPESQLDLFTAKLDELKAKQ